MTLLVIGLAPFVFFALGALVTLWYVFKDYP